MQTTFHAGNRGKNRRLIHKIGAAFILGVALLQPTAEALTIRLPNGTQQVEVVGIGTLESRSEETKVDFMKRVGSVLEIYTKDQKFEACGIIGERKHLKVEEEGKWIVPLITQESHIACGVLNILPADAHNTGESIHSHPDITNGRFYKLNSSDIQFFRMLQPNKRHKAGGRGEYPAKGHAYGFSEQDLSNGSGWLVAGGDLHYHNSATKEVYNHGSTQLSVEYISKYGFDLGLNPNIPGVHSKNIRVLDMSDVYTQHSRDGGQHSKWENLANQGESVLPYTPPFKL